MALFDKVVNEAKGKTIDLKGTLEEKLKHQKMQEIDDATVDRTVQEQRTKTAEMEAREAEAQSRKVNAEVSVAEKFVPQGMWGLMTEMLKDRNPQSPLQVQDMIALLDYARGQQGEAQGDAPSEGMWGFLTTMLTSMMNSNKSTTPMEIVQLIQTIGSLNQAQQQQQQNNNPMTMFTDMVNAFQTMKSLFAPASNNNGSVPIQLGGGAAIPLDQLMQYQNHMFNLQTQREDHDERKKNFQTVREQAPNIVSAIGELANALRSGGGGGKSMITEGTPEAPIEKEIESGQSAKLPAGKTKSEPPQQDMEPVQCPTCGLIFAVPSSMDGMVACPKCAYDLFNQSSETGGANAQKADTAGSESEGPVEQGQNPGADSNDLQG